MPNGFRPDLNYVRFLEIFIIALPILFHGIYGLVVFWMGQQNVTHYGYFRNWMWLAWAGLGLAVLSKGLMGGRHAPCLLCLRNRIRS